MDPSHLLSGFFYASNSKWGEVNIVSEQEQWHIPTADLFKMIDETKKEFSDLKTEMRETRDIIKRYNGLREKIDDLQDEVNDLKSQSKGRFSVWEGIKSWGGWIIAILSLLISLWNKGGL